MKSAFSLLVPILGLSFLFAPALARAEEPAPVELPPETRALLAGLLKAASNAPVAESQSQEVQTLLTDLLKTLSQLRSESNSSVQAAQTTASSAFDLSGLLAGTKTPASSASAPKLSIEGAGPLSTGGLVTGGLSSRLNDEHWRQLFQKRSTGR